MDSNTFWNIFATSKKSTKNGPVAHLFITNIFRKVQESYGNMFEKYYFVNMGVYFFEIETLHTNLLFFGRTQNGNENTSNIHMTNKMRQKHKNEHNNIKNKNRNNN